MLRLQSVTVKKLAIFTALATHACLSVASASGSSKGKEAEMQEFNTDWEHLPREFYRDRHRIFVNRRGSHPDAFMTTNRLTGSVDGSGFWICKADGLERSPVSCQEAPPRNPVQSTIPAHAKISGTWIKGERGASSESNILGRDGSFLTGSDSPLSIPEAEATQGNLQWYGETLVKAGDCIRFDTTASLPVAEMSMGKRYATDYLMNPRRGGGFYLEYHDRPHFHMPQNEEAGGWLTLGKWIRDDQEEGSGKVLAVSAFPVPYGYAVYTGPNVIHNDGLLTGDYMVVYSVTENFSTVIIRNAESKEALQVTVDAGISDR